MAQGNVEDAVPYRCTAKQRGAPQGAPRVFRPCVAQTEEGYIRRLM